MDRIDNSYINSDIFPPFEIDGDGVETEESDCPTLE